MGNVNSLQNKSEELEALLKCDRAYRDCSMYLDQPFGWLCRWFRSGLKDHLLGTEGSTGLDELEPVRHRNLNRQF